ncbi:flagellar biosynthesis regulator FlaF [Paracoccus yeei]
MLNAVRPFSDHAYGNQALRSPRDTEYDALSRVTRMIRQADSNCQTPEAISAVARNNELWILLASDLAHPDNALPDDVRAGLLLLAFFSLRHGQKALAGEATTNALIDINMSVMKGLRSGGGR